MNSVNTFTILSACTYLMITGRRDGIHSFRREGSLQIGSKFPGFWFIFYRKCGGKDGCTKCIFHISCTAMLSYKNSLQWVVSGTQPRRKLRGRYTLSLLQGMSVIPRIMLPPGPLLQSNMRALIKVQQVYKLHAQVNNNKEKSDSVMTACMHTYVCMYIGS